MRDCYVVTAGVCLALAGCGGGETPAQLVSETSGQRSAQTLTITGGDAATREDVADDAAKAREKAFLQSLRPGRDTDGNPATIEGVAPDGREVLIIIQTGEPQLFKGMTPAKFAETAYP